MGVVSWFLLIGLTVGAVASATFAITYGMRANLKSKISHQILSLNIAISLTMFLSILHGLSLLDETVILAMQGVLLIFIDIALLYQFVMLRKAKKEYATAAKGEG